MNDPSQFNLLIKIVETCCTILSSSFGFFAARYLSWHNILIIEYWTTVTGPQRPEESCYIEKIQ